jgi:hypothetical protein
MKRAIFVYDAGILLCTVDVNIDDSTMNTSERIFISYQGQEHEVAYIMGMDYGIIVPPLIVGMQFHDDTHIH